MNPVSAPGSALAERAVHTATGAAAAKADGEFAGLLAKAQNSVAPGSAENLAAEGKKLGEDHKSDKDASANEVPAEQKNHGDGEPALSDAFMAFVTNPPPASAAAPETISAREDGLTSIPLQKTAESNPQRATKLVLPDLLPCSGVVQSDGSAASSFINTVSEVRASQRTRDMVISPIHNERGPVPISERVPAKVDESARHLEELVEPQPTPPREARESAAGIVESKKASTPHPNLSQLPDAPPKTHASAPKDSPAAIDKSNSSSGSHRDSGEDPPPLSVTDIRTHAEPEKVQPPGDAQKAKLASGLVHPAIAASKHVDPAPSPHVEISRQTAEPPPASAGAKESPSVKPKEDRVEGPPPATRAVPAPAEPASPANARPISTVTSEGTPREAAACSKSMPDQANENGGMRSAPADLPQPVLSAGIQSARLMGNDGQAEMRIGLRTVAFGTVEVHAMVHDSQVGLVIGSERGELHRLLGSEVPGLTERLEQQNLRLEGVKFFDQGASFDAGSRSGSDPRSRSFSPPRSLDPGLRGAQDGREPPNDFENIFESRSGLNVRA